MARGGEEEVKPVAGFEPGEGSQRIADANGPSRCGEALDLQHPPTVLVRERWDARSTVAGGGNRRRTALTRRARSPLAAFCQALLPQSTVLTISLIGEIDGPLGERIFLPHFAQPQACPRWATELAVLTARVKASAVKRPAARPASPAPFHGPYSSGGSSQVKNRGAVSVGGAHSISRSSPLCSIFPSVSRRFHTH